VDRPAQPHALEPILEGNIHLQGELRALRALATRGTIILAPTHVSNVDSLVMGLVIHRLGLPPFAYGAGLNLVFIVLPSQAFREVCRAFGECATPDQPVVHCCKGLELGTQRRMSEILFEETCVRQIGVLCGPNIAAELARGEPAGTVIASAFPAIVRLTRHVLSSGALRVFSSGDVVGSCAGR
jgi:hypothetical protein